MLGQSTGVAMGNVLVATTDNPITYDELANQAVGCIVNVADTASPEIKAQAEMFKAGLHSTLVKYMQRAVDLDSKKLIRS